MLFANAHIHRIFSLLEFIRSVYYIVKCESLKKPKNGDTDLVSDGLITSGIFTCNEGYTLNGTERGTCYADGTWDTALPTCGNVFLNVSFEVYQS